MATLTSAIVIRTSIDVWEVIVTVNQTTIINMTSSIGKSGRNLYFVES